MAKRNTLQEQWQRELERSRRAAAEAERAIQLSVDQQQLATAQGYPSLRRQAAAEEREWRKRYIEARQAEATARTAIVEANVAELQGLLASALSSHVAVSFAAYKYVLEAPPFNPGPLGVPVPQLKWEDVAPHRPGTLRRLFGGEERFKRQWTSAWNEYQQKLAQNAAAEQDRLVQLEARAQEYAQHMAQAEALVQRHNAEVEHFEQRFHAGDPDVIEGYFRELVLARSVYPNEFSRRFDVAYRPEPKELVIQYELPGLDVAPTDRAYKYVRTRDEIDMTPRPIKDIKDLYGSIVSQVALRTLHEAFAADAADVVDTIIFNGHVDSIDRATGRRQRPCILSVSAPRSKFMELVLSEVTPTDCLVHLNALMSPHPYDLEPVRPVIDFDLSKYRLVEGTDVLAGLDSRTDLLKMTPTEFEHLVRQLFEAIGMESWVTQASRDDGVDAIAISRDPVFSGLCVVQAKRYSGVVGLEAVHALAGVMDDKRATKGILVTTSWFGKASRDFAARRGRIELYDCYNLTYLIKQYLKKDVLIGLPKQPPIPRIQAGTDPSGLAGTGALGAEAKAN